MKPLTVVTFCHAGSRPIYRPWHCENLRTMFARHLTVSHRFAVVTDDPDAHRGRGYEVYELWPSPHVEATSRHWLFNYNRLALFDSHIGGAIGPRLLNVDLDMIVRANIDDIVSDFAPFKVLSLKTRTMLQGGLFLIEPGAAPINPWRAIHDDPMLIERSRKWVGSDQAVLSELFYHMTGNDPNGGNYLPTWDEEDGVVINHFEWPGWRIFFRTGTRKCWDYHAPERLAYYAESGRSLDEAPPVIPRGAQSWRTPGGVSTRVRRYTVTR
jgi:hypothetical protein